MPAKPNPPRRRAASKKAKLNGPRTSRANTRPESSWFGGSWFESSWFGSTAGKLRQLSLFGADNRDAVHSMVALTLLALTAVIAGVTLGESTTTLEKFPGLLLMVPAAIALRGNIFGALGSRLGTAIHTGTFRVSLRPSSVVGENVLASLVLTLAVSLALAVLAKATALVFGIADSITLADFVVISLIGGLLASVAVLIVALLLAAGSVRYGWDPDNVTAPLVTAVGDVATVPALILASRLLGNGALTPLLASLLAIGGVAGLALSWKSGRHGLRTILAESFPVLVVAVVLDLIAGITVEKRLAEFLDLPTLLVLLPAYLAAAGALGGILSSRLSSKLHLGLLAPTPWPGRAARPDLAAMTALAVPVFVLCGVLASVFGASFGLAGPSLVKLVLAAVLGGAAATAVAMLVAYYSTIAAVRFGLDPDTYGIPLVTSVLDLVGAFTFILAIELLGII